MGHLSLLTLFLLHLLLVPLVWASSKFEPYELNGGLVCAIAGKDFCIVATDTRLSASGYLLQSRNHIATRLWSTSNEPSVLEKVETVLREQTEDPEFATQTVPLSEAPLLIGSAGCSTDCQALQQDLTKDLKAAQHFGQVRRNEPSQVATLLSQTLYQRRNFPYYAFCVAAGLDQASSQGMAFCYDAIGSYEQVAVAVAGTGRESLQPILDRLFVSSPSTSSKDVSRVVEGTASSAISKVCQAYRSVSEREIAVGDKLVLHVTKRDENGHVQCEVLIAPLKED